jgi:hypothetical protein
MHLTCTGLSEAKIKEALQAVSPRHAAPPLARRAAKRGHGADGGQWAHEPSGAARS